MKIPKSIKTFLFNAFSTLTFLSFLAILLPFVGLSMFFGILVRRLAKLGLLLMEAMDWLALRLRCPVYITLPPYYHKHLPAIMDFIRERKKAEPNIPTSVLGDEIRKRFSGQYVDFLTPNQ